MSKQFILFVSAMILSLSFNPSYAEPFPRGCEITGFSFDNGTLLINDTGRQSFYLIRNHGTTPIQLQRIETRDVFMSPPLIAKIDATNTAAFASDVANFHFQCLTTNTEAVTPIDCRDVLEVCEYPRVKFALSNMGNYWVSINKTQQEIINDAVSKGIYLKW